MIQAFLLKMLADYGIRLALIFGIAASALAWDRSRINKGVKQEQSRVEAEGKKVDAKAAVARRAAEREPDKRLRDYYRD
jgi:hypothetical protein